jgi:hypothetical protein
MLQGRVTGWPLRGLAGDGEWGMGNGSGTFGWVGSRFLPRPLPGAETPAAKYPPQAPPGSAIRPKAYCLERQRLLIGVLT